VSDLTQNPPEESKSKRGGKRPGAGRKPSTLKGVLKRLPSVTAEVLLQEINAHQKFIELASSTNEFVALRTLCFLWEQAFGKAKQSVEHKDAPDFNFGNLRTPSFQRSQPGSSNQPN